jgi:L-arabinokinase
VPTAAFYVSGHGFGHASRQIEIINALTARLPDISVVIRTSAARWLFDRTLRRAERTLLIEGACDTGIIQIDSLRLDEAETIRRAAAFHADLPERAQTEATLLHDHGVELVIADAPPLACAAAAAAGIPSIVAGNFTWDWIYAAYGDALAFAPGLIPAMSEAYTRAEAAWRLPMHGGFTAFATIVDVPFVARHARHEVEDTRRRLGLPLDARLALSSFGGYGVNDFDLASLDCLDDWRVVVTGRAPLRDAPRGVCFVDEAHLYDSGLRYEDLVRAVDVVVTKPGYGIISECIANETAMLYTSRGHFAEYDVLVAELPRYVRSRYLDQQALLAGRWRAALEALDAMPPPPERPPTNGADVVAVMIVERLQS